MLLFHGIPETHLMWHRVAPRLAERFTVVATDLRGLGDSGTPPTPPDHAPYSMREIARDQVEVIYPLGYNRFHVVAMTVVHGAPTGRPSTTRRSSSGSAIPEASWLVCHISSSVGVI
jgi:hypothetical protein